MAQSMASQQEFSQAHSVHVQLVTDELHSARIKLHRKREIEGDVELKHQLDDRMTRVFTGKTKPTQREPWMSEEGSPIWSPSRILLGRVVLTTYFECLMASIIVLNLVLMVYESNEDAKCYPEYSNRLEECPFRSTDTPWLRTCNWILLVVYTVELVLRIFVERLGFFRKGWNILDVSIVVLSWASEFLDGYPSLSFLRVMRLSRLIRAARILVSIPELYLLLSGLASSIRTIFFGTCMLLLVLVLCAVLVVQLIHPVNSEIHYGTGCERCGRAFSSVEHAALTLFQQIVAGDSWGLISVPVIEEDPAIGWILLIVCVCISLGMMNLILAVIVERAAEARDHDRKAKVKIKDKARHENMLELARLCSRMDKDDSGCLSLKELHEGYKDADFNDLMNIMDIEPNDLTVMFEALDMKKTGSIRYKDMCVFLHQSQARSPETQTSVLRIEVEAMKRTQKEMYSCLESQMEQHSILLEKISEQLATLPLSSGHAPEPPLSIPSHLLCKGTAASHSEQKQLHSHGDSDGDLLQQLQDVIQKNSEQLIPVKCDLIKQAEGQVMASLDNFASSLKQTLIDGNYYAEEGDHLTKMPFNGKSEDGQVARRSQTLLGPVLQGLGQDLSQEASVLACTGRLLGSVGMKLVEKDVYCGQRPKELERKSIAPGNGIFNI